MIQEEDAPAQKRSTGIISTANSAKNPRAHLCTHIYLSGNGEVQIPAGTSEDLHRTVMITNSRTSCGKSTGLQMASKPSMST